MNLFTPNPNSNTLLNQGMRANNTIFNNTNNWGMNLPRCEAPQLKGRNQAERFQMAPGSEIYLPDADEDIIWWIRVTNNNEHIVVPLDVSLHQDPEPVDLNALVKRLNNLEEQLNNAKLNKSNAKRQHSNAADAAAAATEST